MLEKSQWIPLSANIFSFLSCYILLTQHWFSFKQQAKKAKPFSSFYLSFVFFFCPTSLGFQVIYFFPTLGDAFKLTCFNFDQFLVTCCQFVWFLCCWSTRLLFLLLLSVVSVMPALVNYSGKFSLFPPHSMLYMAFACAF